MTKDKNVERLLSVARAANNLEGVLQVFTWDVSSDCEITELFHKDEMPIEMQLLVLLAVEHDLNEDLPY